MRVARAGGEWISSVEMESLLMSHPDVNEAAVIAVADPRGAERPLVIVTLRAERLDRERVRSHPLARFPRWAPPAQFVIVDALTKAAIGKVDKVRLRRERASAAAAGAS